MKRPANTVKAEGLQRPKKLTKKHADNKPGSRSGCACPHCVISSTCSGSCNGHTFAGVQGKASMTKDVIDLT